MEIYIPDLSEEQRLIRASCRRLVDGVIIPFIRANRAREWDFNADDRVPRSILQAVDKVGLRTLGVPEEFGGVGLDPATESRSFALLALELARGDSGIADKLIQNWKISVLLRNLAPRHLQEKWFKALVDDPGFLMAHCLTEPKGASDRWLPYDAPGKGMDTKAVKDGDHWLLNGHKVFISNGYDANLYIVYANTSPDQPISLGTSSFLVPRDTPGLKVMRCNETLGCRNMNNGEIVFDDCRLPADHLLAHNDALKKAGVYFTPGKVVQAAKNLGIGVAAYEETAKWVVDRVQGGKKLIEHQAVALRVAKMAIGIEAVRAMLFDAARAVDENRPDVATYCFMLRNFAALTIHDVCREAVELHGGAGTMLEAGIEKYWRDAVMFLHMDGTMDVSCFKIAKALFPDHAGAYAG